MMTREEHMIWCKKRALEYVDSGDVRGAYGSMVSDLGKHKETTGHPGIQLGMMQMMMGGLNTEPAMRKFIEGFN
jgi:hypothetical protein